jgi:hypothetical protein
LVARSGGVQESRGAEEEFPSSQPQAKQSKPQSKSMKKLLTLAVTLMMAGASYAGCGIKVPVSGKAEAYNAEKKQLTVGTEAITLAPTAKITNAEGKEVKITELVGKEVTVSTDKHNKKGESVTEKKKS